MRSWFKRSMAALTAFSVLISSTVMPLNAYASDRAHHNIDPTVDPYFYESRGVDRYSRAECGRTPTNNCEWQHVVPLDYWEEIASWHNPTGLSMPVDGRQYYAGERWMALGIEAAGILGLNSADIVYKAMQEQIGQPPWVIARYVPEKAELRIHAIKVIKTPDGFQRVLVADYTPDHGRWHVVWRHFLRPAEKLNPNVKGIDPYRNFTRGINTKTFVNVGPGAAQAILGQAMMHFKAPFGLFVEPELRMKQWQTKSGGFFRKKVTTHTEGYARPKIYLAAPLNMTQGRNSPDPRMMGMYCPRATCSTPDEIVYAGVVLEQLTGGNIPDIEERLFYDKQTKSSWSVFAFALVLGALTFGLGAAMAGTTSWGFSAASGFAQLGTTATLTAGTSIAVGAGVAYAGLNLLAHGGGLTSPQSGWFAATGLDPRSITNGVITGAHANNRHAQRLYDESSARHIQSGRPGTPQGGGNLLATTRMVSGNCPLDWGINQCEAAGLDPGQAPRKDMHTNRALNTTDYTRKVDACTRAGYGSSKKQLNYCLATAVFIDPQKQR